MAVGRRACCAPGRRRGVGLAETAPVGSPALTTGARQGELLGLRWSDIDFQKRLVFLATTKTGEPRVLPLPSPAMAALEPWREVGNGLVFSSETRPGQPFEFRKHWRAALDTAGIEDFRFHDLRHSAASYLVMNGARSRAWKAFVQARLADQYNIPVTICHYPPGTSKWNPIEHRLFSEISKNWKGKPLDSYETIVNYIRTTTTITGLQVRARLVKKL